MALALGSLAACEELINPTFNGFVRPAAPVIPDDPDLAEDNNGAGSRAGLPPGTDFPMPDEPIFRREARNGGDGADSGAGYVDSVSYDAAADTFTVDGIAFDGLNVYARGTAVASLGPYQVYDGAALVTDELNNRQIDQLAYRAIYGMSTVTLPNGEPQSEFSIIRTGAYVDYGFGGFVYERNGTVTLPTAGQANYTGGYAGIRVFSNQGGLEFTRADMTVDIDFDDFNQGEGVKGRVFNRVAFDIDGNPVPVGFDDGELPLPDVNFVIGPGVLDENGELLGEVNNFILNEDGALEIYEEGVYYGILSGDDAEELVGVMVFESTDPRFGGEDSTVRAQETGGFIVRR